ncbi:MAG: hypothetical protein BM564_13400 [Bacteroidetes bacterium MedPE-SWsnd-G2]|nr:MAG: hypothetical protein BM564_13400 [Bacteroidetes bacterium MedPE-SWsnd-G2]
MEKHNQNLKMPQTQISVTGGTGHLGNCVIQYLLESDFLVTALFNNSIPEFEHPNLTWIKGDITDLDSIELLIKKSTVIIHCASLISVGNQDKTEVYRVNVKGTKTILKACEHKKIRLIYISSSAAVKETINDAIYNENRPYKSNKDFCYDWTKAQSEQLVLRDVNEKGLDAIIIRPTSIVGPPDHRPSYFGQTIKDMMLNTMPITIKGGYNVVDIRDVAQTIINSIKLGASGEVYLASGFYISFKQIAEILNPHKKHYSIPIGLLIRSLPIIKLYQRIFPVKWLITRESLITVKRAPKIMDSSKAIKHINHQIRPTSETINDLLDWFKKEL